MHLGRPLVKVVVQANIKIKIRSQVARVAAKVITKMQMHKNHANNVLLDNTNRVLGHRLAKAIAIVATFVRRQVRTRKTHRAEKVSAFYIIFFFLGGERRESKSKSKKKEKKTKRKLTQIEID
jgi:hypothetical protein